jgi:hypothetical protein
MSTKAQVKTQAKTPAAPAAARTPQPPVAVPEHEAERPDIAAQLEAAARLGHSLGAVGVDGPAPPIIQRQELPEEEEEELQMKREPAAVQCQELPEEEEEELMLKPEEGWVGSQGGPVPPAVEDAIHRARGGGQPMEGALQEQMSASLGHDFSGVRVHTNAEADVLNQQLQATAFTTGLDIFFKRGAYAPTSASGRALIAHELTHVVQQVQGWVRGGARGLTVRPAGDAFEQEAEAQQRRLGMAAGLPLLALKRAADRPDLARPADIRGRKTTLGNRAVRKQRDPSGCEGSERLHEEESTGEEIRARAKVATEYLQGAVAQRTNGGKVTITRFTPGPVVSGADWWQFSLNAHIKDFDEKTMRVVRKVKAKKYETIHGQKKWRATKAIGKTKFPTDEYAWATFTPNYTDFQKSEPSPEWTFDGPSLESCSEAVPGELIITDNPSICPTATGFLGQYSGRGAPAAWWGEFVLTVIDKARGAILARAPTGEFEKRV